MLCWSCGKKVPDDAKRCRFCEADVEPEPTGVEIDIVRAMLAEMDPEAMSELRAAFEESETGEEFVNRIMVGTCPKCDSSNTGDCGDDPEINGVCVGRCFDRGQFWCLDCGQLLREDQPTCSRCSE